MWKKTLKNNFIEILNFLIKNIVKKKKIKILNKFFINNNAYKNKNKKKQINCL